jgi:branched-chain amino acid transport system substrate-binding protein
MTDRRAIRRTQRGRSSRSLVAAVALCLLSPAWSPGPAAAADAPLKIGVLLPLSGRYASAGQSNKRGIDLVIDAVNKSGGIKALGGARLQLVVADDTSDQVTTSQEARRLINQDKVIFILGPYATPEAEAALPVSERAGIGMISTQASYDDLFARHYRYFTTVSMTSSQFGASYAEFVRWLNEKHAAGIKKVAITYPNNDYGKTAAQAATDGLGKQGVSVIGSFGFPPDVTDMTPIVQKVKAAGPDAVISIGYLQDGVLLAQARAAQGYTSPPLWIGGSDAFSNDRLWQILGDTIAKAALSGDTFALAQFDRTVKMPGVQWLDSAAAAAGYKPIDIDQAMAAGAQAAWVLVQTIEDAKSADPAVIGAALHRVKLAADDPHVIMPQFADGLAFDESGKPSRPVALFEHWENGRKVVVYPEKIATGAFPQ